MNNLDIAIWLILIFLPLLVTLLIAILKKRKMPPMKRNTETDFNVIVPEFVMYLGILLVVMVSMLMLIPTFFGNPHWILYFLMGIFIWLGMYLIIKTLTFRIAVKGEKITIYSLLKKPVTFTFSDIVSVKRETKKNKVGSERIVIKTNFGAKVIAENVEISYKRLVKAIEKNVDKDLQLK